ncbi:MAG: hypothetical protein WAO35_11510 [Terriglobia bacterium]
MKPIFLALCIAVSTQLFAQSGNFQQTVNGGTLKYQVVYGSGPCGTGTTSGWSFSAFTYTDSNGYIWTLSGGGGYVLSTGSGNGCPPSGPVPSSSVVVTGGWGFNIELYPGPTDYPGVSYVTIPHGYISPKYIVTSVTYAPPGPSSYVEYGSDTVTGNQLSTSTSFTTSTTVTQSASLKAGITHPLAGGSFATGWSTQDTYTQTDTETVGSSATFTTDLQISQAYRTPGAPTTWGGFWHSSFNPHDYDLVWFWLNADELYNTPSTGNVTWLGYAWDACDTANGIDVFNLGAGYLDNDWSYNLLGTGVDNALARGWTTTVQPNVAPQCNTQTFPSGGSGPAITHGPNSDFTNMATADPLLSQSYALNLKSNGQTTGDGRYTRYAGFIENNQIIPPAETDLVYNQALPNGQPAVATGKLALTNSSDFAQTATYTSSQTFGVDSTFTNTLWLISFDQSLATSNTITSTFTTKQDITTSTSVYGDYYIVSPTCTVVAGVCNPIYNGPVQWDIYQDNNFATFMFWPLNGL